MVEKKAWYKSRTIWGGVAVVIVQALAYLTGAGVFEGLGLSAEAAGVARNWANLLSAIIGLLIIQFRRESSAAITGTNAAKRIDPPGGG